MKNVHDVNTNDTKERYIAVRSRVHHQNEKQKTLSSAQIRKRAAILFLIRVSHISVNIILRNYRLMFRRGPETFSTWGKVLSGVG